MPSSGVDKYDERNRDRVMGLSIGISMRVVRPWFILSDRRKPFDQSIRCREIIRTNTNLRKLPTRASVDELAACRANSAADRLKPTVLRNRSERFVQSAIMLPLFRRHMRMHPEISAAVRLGQDFNNLNRAGDSIHEEQISNRSGRGARDCFGSPSGPGECL
jgi:hypothetical protein